MHAKTMEVYIDRSVDGTKERRSLIGRVLTYLDNHMFHPMLALSVLGSSPDTAHLHQNRVGRHQ